MAIRYHTVILVPHARAKLRKWRISNLQLALALGGLALLTTTSALILFAFFTGGVDGAQVERLRRQNEELRQANAAFEQSVTDLQGKLGDYESRTRKLAIVAGLDSFEGGEAGIGGEAAEAADLDLLDYRANRLSGRLDRVEAKLEERLRWISSVPSVAPVRGILTSGFGGRRDPVNGRRSFHPAIDIAAPPGREVRAPADGLVTRAGRIGGLGNAVYLSHGFGIGTRFGHMARLTVKPGDRVEQGDVLGYVGSTGRATGYHLHYEVHVDGEAIDPLAYILDSPAATGG
ncbi:MAG TPA: peptidoglycan DD-metalloendopeptidase family protein [Thermoanaerobaculia bacterium]|nr:peptidoglycan DD-metalloendopeptidase family protein [Thermoanaerobaculia bacterium]